MTVVTILCVLLLLLGFSALIWVFLLRTRESIQRELGEVTARFNSHLEQTVRMAQQAGEGSLKAMTDLYSRLGTLEESSHRIYEIGKEIGKLQDVLRAPKARGGFGEFLLADLLGQMIPKDNFQLQYTFRSGSRVDAVIFVGDHLVSIDAKFPLDNFQRFVATEEPDARKRLRKEFARDVKRHIDSISSRYILPEEGTFNFALMYIPAENLYYEMIISDNDPEDISLSAYALERNVIPVSPNSFYAYLQVILLGLKGLRIDQAAREIAESLMKMQGDFGKIMDGFSTLGLHLGHARGAFERVQRDVDQFQAKLSIVDQVKLQSHDHSGVKSIGVNENGE